MAEHFQETGIGAIWLSPIFKSPLADFGYDISDFVSIDSTYGTMEDFLSLQKKLKSLGTLNYSIKNNPKYELHKTRLDI